MMKAYNEEHESKKVNLPPCYVCGTPNCAHCVLCVRQTGPGKAFFPFLETHEPPENSEPITDDQVLACNLCFQMLHFQWRNYEENKVPLVKRLYWLKRDDGLPYSGVEMGMQTEYASQFLGLTPDPSIAEDRASISGPSRSHISTLQNSNQIATNLSHTLVKKPNSKHISVAHPHLDAVPPIPLESSKCIKLTVSPSSSVALTSKAGLLADLRPLPCAPQEEALDLSVDRTAKTAAACTSQVLDLSMPDKNASTEVCYVCGEHYSRGTLLSMCAKELGSHRPYFPSLMYHPRPSKSHPMEASGCVQSCPCCYASLLTQYAFFNSKGIDHKNRLYLLGKFGAPVENSVLCYDCHRPVPFDEAKVVYITNSERKSFSPDVGRRPSAVECPQLLHRAAKAVCCQCPTSCQPVDGSLSDGSSDPIEVCDTSSPEAKGMKTSSIPRDVRPPARPRSNGALLRSSPALGPEVAEGAAVSCFLCHQNHSKHSMQWVSSDSTSGDAIYFPFIKNIHRIKSSLVSDDGKVLICAYCHLHLRRQWDDFEARNVAMERRVFSCRPPSVGSASPRLTPNLSPPHCSPDPASSEEHSQHHQKGASLAKVFPTETYLNLKELEIDISKNAKSNYALPSMSSQNPLNISVNCYLCGLPSERGETYAVLSQRSRPADMFFPFLDTQSALHENTYCCNGSFLICTYCFHTLVSQWQRFEKKKVEPLGRFYNTYSFKCYVCSLKTYRKRLHKISVENFPFLKSHARPHDALIIDNGGAVAVCTDCHTRMCEQYHDMEKTGVPVDRRQYNWIKKPAPPQFPPSLQAAPPLTPPPVLAPEDRIAAATPARASDVASDGQREGSPRPSAAAAASVVPPASCLPGTVMTSAMSDGATTTTATNVSASAADAAVESPCSAAARSLSPNTSPPASNTSPPVPHTSSPASNSSPSAPNTSLRASNTGPPAPNTSLPASNTGPPAPNTNLPASNTGPPAPNTSLPASNTGPPAPNTSLPASNTGPPAPNTSPIAPHTGCPAPNTSSTGPCTSPPAPIGPKRPSSPTGAGGAAQRLKLRASF